MQQTVRKRPLCRVYVMLVAATSQYQSQGHFYNILQNVLKKRGLNTQKKVSYVSVAKSRVGRNVTVLWTECL